MGLLRPLGYVAGGSTVFATFFFATLLCLNHFDSKARDALRTEHVKFIRVALERYRQANGVFPSPFLDNPVSDLASSLVGGGHIASIPSDPLWTTGPNQYRYVSAGNSYGLLVHLELATGTVSARGTCITGVGTEGTRWWDQPPNCPF